MIDDPEKTADLLETLQRAVPFVVVVTPELAAMLKPRFYTIATNAVYAIIEVTYAGDAGGIMCRIKPEDGGTAVVSLTHLRVPATLPFARQVAVYQKHRTKKIKKRSTI